MRRRLDGEAGAGLISAVFGVAMFLTLLFAATQLALHLYATSVVTAATFDAARMVAGSRAGEIQQPGAVLALQQEAEAHAVSLMGRYAQDNPPTFTWCPVWSSPSADCPAHPGRVALTVEMRHPSLVLPWLPARSGLERLTRTVTVRREAFDAG